MRYIGAFVVFLMGFSFAALAKNDLPLLDCSVFNRMDFIHGSEIGAWNLDGGNAVNNAVCRQKVIDAKIPVIRYGVWGKFDDLQQEKPLHRQTLEQFNHAIDGIRSLGAYPFIKLPPVWDKQCDGAPDYWSLAWLKEIIKAAGNRVQLYEFTNEPNNYCKWDGKTYAAHWKEVVPELKRYARSLGFEIYIGGPSWSNSYPKNISEIREFLTDIKEAYQQSKDPDLIPDFISTHTYLTEKENASLANMQKAIDGWGIFYDNLRSIIDQTFGNLGPQIKIADSEYNFTINQASALQNDRAFTDAYMKAMFDMFRQHHIWMANQFTIQSHQGEALDMLTKDCTAKPLYNSFVAQSIKSP